MDEKVTRMVFATAALAAVAAVLAGPAGAYLPEGDGVHAVGAQSEERQPAQSVEPGTIPYLSQGIGVDESQFAGQASQVDAQHQALVRNGDAKSAGLELDPAIRTAIEARSGGKALGLNGDSALTRAEGLQQELPGSSSPATYPSHVIGAGGSQWDGRTLPVASGVGSQLAPQVTATSSGDDFDWASFGAGAGMAALLAVGCAGVLLTTRRRHTVGMS